MQEDANTKGVTLHCDSCNVPIVVDADQVRVEQIVWNLLLNAVKVHARGRTRRHAAAGGRRLRPAGG
jgi:two-component system CheB/CheR fusion protein